MEGVCRLRTSLCLQYKPHHIAAGAIFLAAKFLKVKLPNDGEVVWWQAFEVTPAQLEDISNQMLELYEQNGPSPGLRGNEPGGRSGVINQNLGISQAYAGAAPISGCSQVTERSLPGGADISEDSQQFLNPVSNSRGREKFDGGANLQKLSKIKHSDVNMLGTSQGYERNEQTGSRRAVESKEYSDNSGDETRVKFGCPDIEGKQSWASLDDVNKDKVKAALEKRRRSRGEGMDPRPTKPKVDLIDEDDLIRELESGVEAAAQAEKAKQERKENWARSLYRVEQEGIELRKEHRDEGENRGKRKKSNLESFPEKKRSRSSDFVPMQGEQERSLAKISYDHAQEGKLPFSNPHEQVSRLNDKWSGSPMLNQIEKGGSPAKWRDYGGRD